LHKPISNAVQEAEERLLDHRPLQISDEQRHRDRIDGLKMYFDLLKQVTTLSAGSAVLIATLVDRLFPAPKAKLLIAFSLLGFLLALGAAIFGMAGYAAKTRFSNPRNYDEIRDMGIGSTATTLVSFVVGVGSLAVFAVINLLF
jgi:hypothetical protein